MKVEVSEHEAEILITFKPFLSLWR